MQRVKEILDRKKGTSDKDHLKKLEKFISSLEPKETWLLSYFSLKSFIEVNAVLLYNMKLNEKEGAEKKTDLVSFAKQLENWNEDLDNMAKRLLDIGVDVEKEEVPEGIVKGDGYGVEDMIK